MAELPLRATLGFVALVHIAGEGGPPQREAYLIAVPTVEEAFSKLRAMYSTQPKAEFRFVAMAENEVIRQKMQPGEVKPWQ
jgi:hypothetical protein